VNTPPILLADEPTGNLDSKTGQEVLDLLVALNKRGRTIIMVTHSDDAAHMAGRVITIRDGTIVTDREGGMIWPVVAQA
jgi:putative ABC transport system ATP-binding protein